MKKIRKAIIPIAGHGVRMMPATRAVRKALFPIVDSRGLVRPVLQLIVEEAVNAGIEEICLVTAPEDEALFRGYFSQTPGHLTSAMGDRPDLLEASRSTGELTKRLSYVTQNPPRGLGDAVLCAKSWTGDEPVLIMLGDHLYLSREERCCARQLLDAFVELQAPVSGVIRKTAESLEYFGTIAGRPVHQSDGLYAIDTVVEKPAINHAKEHLRVEGMPDDMYLCWFGLHAMTPDLFTCLEQIERDRDADGVELQLTDAQAMLAAHRDFFALEINGDHFDTGSPGGYVDTVAAFADPTLPRKRSNNE